MRMASHPPSPSVKERKVSQSASCKIDCIVKQLFLPMLGMPTPDRTSFQPDDDTQVIRQVAEDCPGALASEADFVEYMVVLYRKFQAQSEVFIHKDSDKSDAKRVDPLLPLRGQAMLALQLPVQLPVQILEDGADLPKALTHAVGATACVGELHHLCAGF